MNARVVDISLLTILKLRGNRHKNIGLQDLGAIEVDTPAEREYLEQFVQRTGLDTGVAQQLQSAVGMS